ISLVLPHRAALYSTDPLALAAHQVLNRHVRGILEGCKLVNVAAFYPGRDLVTVDRRILGLVSFEIDHAGALLVEAILANTRDFRALPAFLDAIDPPGVIPAEMLTADGTTCLARELQAELTTEEVAALLRRGYEKQFSLACEPRRLDALDEQAIKTIAM